MKRKMNGIKPLKGFCPVRFVKKKRIMISVKEKNIQLTNYVRK